MRPATAGPAAAARPGAPLFAVRDLGRPILAVNRACAKHPMLTIALTMWMVSCVGVMIGWAAPNDGPTTPAGMGTLLPLPDISNGATKTLFESSGFNTWGLDAKYGQLDFWQPAVNAIAETLWVLAVVLVYGAIGLVFWLLSIASFSNVTDAMAGAVGTSSAALLTWLLPSALVIGLVWNWIQHKGSEILSAITWTLVSGVMAVSLALFPQQWVDGVNNVRSVGADAVLSLADNPTPAAEDFPFPWPAANYDGQSKQNAMLRKAGDAVWRGLVVTPWCAAEFGSLEACQRYGADIVKLGSDYEGRQEYIAKTMSVPEGGDDAPTVKFTQGDRPQVRLGIGLVSLIVNLIFCGVMLVLAFSAIGALISAFFHLILGVPFALMWCVEGRVRQIGLRWLESLIGTLIQGIIALGIFSALLVLLTINFALLQTSGWLVTMATALVIAATALAFRSQVAGFFHVVAGGHRGAAVLGALALRGLSRGVGGRRTAAPPRRDTRAAAPTHSRRGLGTSRPSPRPTPSNRPPRTQPGFNELRPEPRPMPGPNAGPRSNDTRAQPRPVPGPDPRPTPRSMTGPTGGPAGRPGAPRARNGASPAPTAKTTAGQRDAAARAASWRRPGSGPMTTRGRSGSPVNASNGGASEASTSSPRTMSRGVTNRPAPARRPTGRPRRYPTGGNVSAARPSTPPAPTPRTAPARRAAAGRRQDGA